jgi:hypothetical protein
MIKKYFSQPITRGVFLTLITVATCLLLVKPLARLPQRVFIDYNEGVMAYFSQEAICHGPLYQPPEAFVLNNYPPLSFYVTGTMGSMVGDLIIGGRIAAMAGFFVTAVMMSLAISRYTQSAYLSAVAGILFLGYMCIYHAEYVGMNDPQWMAHAFMMTGFVVFLYNPGSRAALLSSIVLMVLSGFIKHNLIAMPLAIALWLYLHDRRRFYEWLIFSLVLLTTALLVMRSVYGEDFLGDLFLAPRVYRVGLIARVGLWLTPLIIYAVASVALFVLDSRREVRLLLIASVLSLVWGVFISGGSGVAYNAIFDFIIVSFIASAVAVDSLAKSVKAKIDCNIHVVLLAVLILSLPVLLKTPYELFLTKEYLKGLPQLEKQSGEDIRFLAEFPDPVMCENLAFSYWAGKSFSFDFFTTGQKLQTGKMAVAVLRDLVQRKEFSLIQFSDTSQGMHYLPVEISRQISYNYTTARRSPATGFFLIPRNK